MKITDDMLTEWFPAKQKPRREGWYECHFIGTARKVMRYWTGSKWERPIKVDVAYGYTFGAFSGDRWRGLKHRYLAPGESIQIGASMYLVNFDEGPDRPSDDE